MPFMIDIDIHCAFDGLQNQTLIVGKVDMNEHG